MSALADWVVPTISASAAIVGAFVGAGAAIYAGILNDRRVRQAARVARVRELSAELIGAISGLKNLYEKNVTIFNNTYPGGQPDFVPVETEASRALSLAAELTWMTDNTNLSKITQEFRDCIETFVNAGAVDWDLNTTNTAMRSTAQALESALRKILQRGADDIPIILKNSTDKQTKWHCHWRHVPDAEERHARAAELLSGSSAK